MACSRISLQLLTLPHKHRVHKISYYLESVTEKIIGREALFSLMLHPQLIGYKLHDREARNTVFNTNRVYPSLHQSYVTPEIIRTKYVFMFNY